MYRSRNQRSCAPWAALGLILICHLPARSEENTPAVALKIGVVSSVFRDMPDPVVAALLRPVKSLVEAQTGITCQVDNGGDALLLAQKLADDKVQVGVFHGFEFAWARQKHPKLQPLVIAVNQQKHPNAVSLVSANSAATTLADVKGKTLALPKFSREYVHLYVDRRCCEEGQGPLKYFAKITTPSDYEDAIDQVIDGTADVTILDSVAVATYKQRRPGRFAKLKVLQESETFPATVLAYHQGGMGEEQALRVRKGMIDASQTPRGQQMLAMCRVSGFEAVPDNYEKLLKEIVKAYPPPALAKPKD